MSDQARTRKTNSLMLAEIRGDIKRLLVAVGKLKTMQGVHSESIKRIEDKIDNLPENCTTGKNHEDRLNDLEVKPEKTLSIRALKVGIYTAMIGVPISIIFGVLALIIK